MISVIIPTYKEPEYLDLCIKSALDGQTYDNQILVVVDGFLELNKPVLDKYHGKIDFLDLEQNYGLPRATNIGVYSAKFDKVMVVNDDNVFPKAWDKKLIAKFSDQVNVVISPNQIEPNPSMFKQFEIKNYGETAQTFDMQAFVSHPLKDKASDFSGSTLPFMMSKKLFLSVGGWDENYPTNGVVADWDFFLKCKNLKFNMLRTYDCPFYHFAKVATGQNRYDTEFKGHEYAHFKWGSYIKHNPEDNSKHL